MLTKAPEPLGDAPREVHGVPNEPHPRPRTGAAPGLAPHSASGGRLFRHRRREPVPVEGRVRAILRRFLHAVRLPLARLFDGARSRSEIVATFLAVLELSRTHRIRLHGEGEDIELTLNDEKGSETRDTTGEHA